MTEDFGIELLQMMENAGRALAWVCRSRFLSGDAQGKAVTVLSGRGANGGGALACARRLHIWGTEVRVVLAGAIENKAGATFHQLSFLRKIGVSIREAGSARIDLEFEVIIDGLIGYGLQGSPHGRVAELIESANIHPAPILALDVPSGIDPTTGKVHTPAIRASATLALALPKAGLRVQEARPYVGELFLADIGVPAEAYRHPTIGLEVPSLFAQGDVIRVW